MASHARAVNSFCEIFFPLDPFPPADARVTAPRARDVERVKGNRVSIAFPTRCRSRRSRVDTAVARVVVVIVVVVRDRVVVVVDARGAREARADMFRGGVSV